MLHLKGLMMKKQVFIPKYPKLKINEHMLEKRQWQLKKKLPTLLDEEQLV